MEFKRQTIVPGGRYKYGEYLSAGNVTSKITSVVYGGNGSTEDLGGGDNPGGDTGGTDNITWQLFLSQGSFAFDGQEISAVGYQDFKTSVVGLLGTDRAETFVGDVTGTHTYDVNTDTYDPELPANYGITGMPQTGMSIVVSDNGDTGTTIQIILDNTLPASANTGTLQIPCAVSLNQNQYLENSIIDWEDAYKAGKVMTLVLEFSWSVSSNAQSAYRLDLSNDSGSINCDEDGNVLTGATRPSCQATLYFGNDPYTAATYNVTYNNSQNVTGLGFHTSNGVCYIDYDSPTYFDFDGDHLDVTITAYASSVPQSTKVFTITKSMPSEGHPATSYWMVFNSNSVKVNPNTNPATVTPSVITAEVMMQVGQDTPTAATGCSLFYGYTTSPATAYPNTGVTVNVSNEALYFVAKKGNVIVDGVEQIPILKDGLKGESGQSAYRLDLNNQSASINCDSNGNILTGAVRPTCTAKLYLGTTACTGVTYSIATGSCSYSGVTINSSTGVMTFNAGTSSTPFWFDTSYTCIELTIEAKIGGVLYGSAIMSVSRSIAGADGRSITGVTEWYALNNNQSTAPTSGWTTGITNPTSATPFLWNYEEIHYNAGSATTTSPVIIARYTKDGKGISAITEFYAINNSSTTPPTSWSNTMEVPTDSKPYLWNKEEILYTDGSIDYTDPVIIGIKGSNGQPAVSYWLELSADEVKLTTANTFTPATITASAWKQIGENAPTGATDATILWGYDTTTPTSTYTSTITVTGTSHNYITFRLMVGNVQRDIETVLILRDGKDGTGTQGRQGAAIRGPIDWYDGSNQSGRRWCNGQLTDNSHPEDAMWIDVIIKDGTYYYCNTSYTEAGQSWNTVKSRWTSADTEFDFVATNILLASTATINFLTNNELYLRDSNGNITGGAAGGDGINFWAGADTPGNAPFQVSNDGSFKATKGTFSGFVQIPYKSLGALTTVTEYNGFGYMGGDDVNLRLYETQIDNNSYITVRTDTATTANVKTVLYLPEPTYDLNGMTYKILLPPKDRITGLNTVIPWLAIAVQGQSATTSTGKITDLYHVINDGAGDRGISVIALYKGYIELTCMPNTHLHQPGASCNWYVTNCTGPVDLYGPVIGDYSLVIPDVYKYSCGNVISYSYQSPTNMVNKIVTDSNFNPGNNTRDTLYVTRN